MKLIMENWKRFLTEGDIANIIQYAVQKGLATGMSPEAAAEIFDSIRIEGSYRDIDVHRAQENWESYDLPDSPVDTHLRPTRARF